MNKAIQQTEKSLTLIIMTFILLALLGFLGYMAWVVFSLPLMKEQLTNTISVVLLLDDYQKFSHPILYALIVTCLICLLIILEIYRRSVKRKEIEKIHHQAILSLLDESSFIGDADTNIGDADIKKDFEVSEAINLVISRLMSHNKITQEISASLSAAVNETRVVSSQLAESSEHQSEEITIIIKMMKDMAASMQTQSAELKNTVIDVQQISALSKKSNVIIQNSVIGLRNTQNKINDKTKIIKKLSEKFKDIESVAFSLDDMADQAHILGLNAAIQASTAGESGKGFAVIAEEIQKLAERSGTSIKHITSMISNIREQVDSFGLSVDEVAHTITKDKKVSEEASLTIKKIDATSSLLVNKINVVINTLLEQEQQSAKATKMLNVIQDISSQLLFGTKNTADIMDEIEDKTSLTSNNSNELDRLKFLNQKPIAGE
ncbi:methyl-accepting chemotaxis protein [Porticoccus sp.]|nr:methyl-accepting chemotaxis protein [Porticoccus sp.]